MYKALAIKLVKYNFRVEMLVFPGSFTLTIPDHAPGPGPGLSPR